MKNKQFCIVLPKNWSSSGFVGFSFDVAVAVAVAEVDERRS